MEDAIYRGDVSLAGEKAALIVHLTNNGDVEAGEAIINYFNTYQVLTKLDGATS
jgi:hypothetical protein